MAGGVVEYEKEYDDDFVWSWDWTNELVKGFFMPSAQVAFYSVYDDSAAEYRDIIARSWQDFVEMAAWPLVATLQVNDALYFGNLAWPDEAAFTIDTPSTPAVYAGDALTWEYLKTTGAWAALTLVYDETDTTANDGKRSFQGGGEIRFNRPADMESTLAINSRDVEWIRVRPTTVANVTTVPIFAYDDANEFVSSVALVDNGVTHSEERVDGDISSALVTGLGDLEARMTSCVGRTVKKVFRFVEPSTGKEDDYGS
jgi:hypothetical protein